MMILMVFSLSRAALISSELFRLDGRVGRRRDRYRRNTCLAASGLVSRCSGSARCSREVAPPGSASTSGSLCSKISNRSSRQRDRCPISYRGSALIQTNQTPHSGCVLSGQLSLRLSPGAFSFGCARTRLEKATIILATGSLALFRQRLLRRPKGALPLGRLLAAKLQFINYGSVTQPNSCDFL